MSRLASLAVALVLLALTATIASARMHEDKKLGYRVRHPKDWTPVPIKTEERWIVAKYIADREYYDHSEEWPTAYRPEMTVILFPEAITKKRGVTKHKEGDDTVIEIKNPYRDYEQYLERNLSEGGWHVSLKEEKKDGDLAWTLIEVKIDKLASAGKKRIVTGVFHAPDADYAVQFEILEASYKKLRNEVYGCLKSFRFIPREGSIAKPKSGRIKVEDEWKLTPEERKKRRKESQEIAYRRAKEALPKGWAAFEYKGLFVLSHVDRKDALKIAAQAVAILKWLEKTFPCLGDEYARPPILRICATSDEASAYRSGSGDSWSREYNEVVTFVDRKDWGFEWQTEDVNRSIFHDWLRDKDRLLDWWTLPNWISTGLDRYIGLAKLKGNKLEFEPDVYELDQMRQAKRKGELHPISEIVTLTGDEFWKKWHTSDQCASLIRFLMDGPGKRMKKGRDLLPAYLLGLRDYLAEEEKKEEAKRKKEEEERKASGEKEEEKSEEEEEAEEAERMKKRREDWKKQEAKTLKAIFDHVFGEWSDDDWAKLERAYRAWLD